MGEACPSRPSNQRTMEQNQLSKFCIEFEGMTLPDALAAVVIAWHDAQDTNSSNDWVGDLRTRIKRECGKGWIIDAVGKTKLNPNGKCRLSKIAPDRRRTSVVLPQDWSPENSDIIFGLAFGICQRHMDFGETLQEALSIAIGMRSETIARQMANVF